MKILYVASEGAPYSASGGLGDVIGALPKSVAAKDPSSKCEVILPLYGNMKVEHRAALEYVADLTFKLSWRTTGATIFKIEQDNVTYYFVENHYYFDRAKTYGEWDDGERFAFFSMAVIEFIIKTGNIPDVLHANDWQSALAVIYLKTKYSGVSALSKIRTLFTIHNIEFQGKYDPLILGDVFDLDEKYRDIVEFNGCINLLKGAMTVSDYTSTVSPNYACELRHDFFAFGLASIVSSISHKMCGIINGIDYTAFSPKVAGEIYATFDKRTIKSGKAKNKLALQREIGLPEDETVPLVVMVTRLTDQKGLDLVLHILNEFLKERVQVAVLGTGDEKYEEAFANLDSIHPNFRALIKFDRTLSKKMYAAADIFLMPSKSEPCGLAQMIACAYGTVPVVRAVGGLYDSIKPYGSEGANGFTFNNYNAHELLFTLKNALSVYNNPKEWAILRKSAIDTDFSWDKSAAKYIELYNVLINW
ncbi:MAG: glycogen synthase [Clostridia bacterium]|nr:glycogen synthase [Clostridia bacterium]